MVHPTIKGIKKKRKQYKREQHQLLELRPTRRGPPQLQRVYEPHRADSRMYPILRQLH
ncbi:hypothetical protein F444_19495 [Phytophthora nicotianae P1976]|uniref:Uncharacterized protein n=1 Tax=Phytophthora nicotianae P1976 TaxID=1317066 RepID=A0A080Z7J5_PHYNI|nr:hypothetical protein F444_19495 [Phytophthora nicotianae P1976]